MPIVYRQDVVDITRQHGSRELLVTNLKQYKPASDNEFGQSVEKIKINHSIADRDAVATPTGEFISAANWEGSLVSAGALQASIGSSLSPLNEIYFQLVDVGLSPSKKHQRLDLRRAKMAVVTDGQILSWCRRSSNCAAWSRVSLSKRAYGNNCL